MKVFKEVLCWSHFLTFTITGPTFQNYFDKFDAMLFLELFTQNATDFDKDDSDPFFNHPFYRLCFEKEELELYLRQRDNGMMNLAPSFFKISCSKVDDVENQWMFYLAFNASIPSNLPTCPEPKQSRNKSAEFPGKTISRAYNSSEDGYFGSLPTDFNQEILTAFRVHAILCLENQLINKWNMTLEEITQLTVRVEYRSSTNPIFWTEQLLLNAFHCDLETFKVDFSPFCKTGYFEFCNNKTEEIPKRCKAHFLKKISHEILKFATVFEEIKSSGLHLIANGNFSKKSRRKTFEKKIQGAITLLKADDVNSWKVSAKKKKALEKEEEENKPNIDSLLIEPLFHQLLSSTATLPQAQGYIHNLAKETSERGEVVRKNFLKIMGQLKQCASYHDEVLANTDDAEEPKTRREVLGSFLFEYRLKEVNIKEEIDRLWLLPEVNEMIEALKTFFLWTLGRDFIAHWANLVFLYDSDCKVTKQEGIFMRGSPSFGKSFLWKLLFLPFQTFKISNSNVSNVDPKILEKAKTEKNKSCTIYPHFLDLDEFNAQKLNGQSTMSVEEFNELFNSSKEYHAMKIKYYTLYLKGNAAVVLCTHHPIEEFMKKYDRSVGSRFAAIIDLNAMIFFKDAPGFPQREEGESDGIYFERLKEGGFAFDKPLFPLSCYSGQTWKLHLNVLKKLSTLISPKCLQRLCR